jgi:hypothetical protein
MYRIPLYRSPHPVLIAFTFLSRPTHLMQFNRKTILFLINLVLFYVPLISLDRSESGRYLASKISVKKTFSKSRIWNKINKILVFDHCPPNRLEEPHPNPNPNPKSVLLTVRPMIKFEMTIVTVAITKTRKSKLIRPPPLPPPVLPVPSRKKLSWNQWIAIQSNKLNAKLFLQVTALTPRSWTPRSSWRGPWWWTWEAFQRMLELGGSEFAMESQLA